MHHPGNQKQNRLSGQAKHSSCPQPPVRGSRSPHVWAAHADVPVGPRPGCRGQQRVEGWGGGSSCSEPAEPQVSFNLKLHKSRTGVLLRTNKPTQARHVPRSRGEGLVLAVCSISSHSSPPVLPCPGTSLRWPGQPKAAGDFSATPVSPHRCWRDVGAAGSTPSTWQGSTLPWLPTATGKNKLWGCPCPSLCPIHLCPVPGTCLWNGAGQKGKKKKRKGKGKRKGEGKKITQNKKKIKNQPKAAVGNQKSELRHFGSRDWNV